MDCMKVNSAIQSLLQKEYIFLEQSSVSSRRKNVRMTESSGGNGEVFTVTKKVIDKNKKIERKVAL